MLNLDTEIKIYGLAPGSIVDGPGIRFGVFMQGCSHHCKACHNPESQNHNAGSFKTVGEIIEEFEKHKSCEGVTLSGGEPFDQSAAVCVLAKEFKKRNVNIWCYTGYLFEDLLVMANSDESKNASKYCNKEFADSINGLLCNIDVLVDGEFVLEKKSYDALYCGSTNQRLIDVPKSLHQNKLVLWSQDFVLPQKPSSW